MTTETQIESAEFPLSMGERMARIEAQQEIIIELLKSQDAKIDALDHKVDTKIDALDHKIDTKIDAVNARIDATNHRIFMAGLGLFTIVGAGVAAYVVNLLV